MDFRSIVFFSFACVLQRRGGHWACLSWRTGVSVSHTPAANIINSSLNALGYSAFVARLFRLYYMVDQTLFRSVLIENFCRLVFLPSCEPNPVSPCLSSVDIFLKPPATSLHASATHLSPPHSLSEPATRTPLCTSAEKATAQLLPAIHLHYYHRQYISLNLPSLVVCFWALLNIYQLSQI